MKVFTTRILGCFIYLCCTFVATAQPVASFTINVPALSCASSEVTFTNQSTGESPLTFVWEFGIDGATDTLTNPSFTYQECGEFHVVLTVTDGLGLSDADTQEVVIHCTPVAAFGFTPINVCDSGAVHFTDESTPTDSITSRQWNFGDPASGTANTSSLTNPDHYYLTPGIFLVTLEVTSQFNCTSTTSDSVIIFHPQSYFIIEDSACLNDSVLFIDLSTSQDAVLSWSWNFDDPTSGANVSIKQNPNHIFQEAGDYNVRLTITTVNGCINSFKKTIHVYGLPLVTAGNDVSLCPFDSVQLHASGASGYLWQPASLLNDASLSDPIAFPVTTQDFMVTGTDINGCSAKDTVKVILLPLPPADAGIDTAVCIGNAVLLHASGGTSYVWSPPGTLNNDSIAEPLASPQANTTYTVFVTDENGCSASDSVIVAVSPIPIVTISELPPYYCANAADVVLSGTPAGGIFSGDGVSGSILNPSSLTTGGPYTIIYAYSNETGCAASETTTFFIVSLPQVSISVTDSALCLNEAPVSFEINPAGGILSGTGIINSFFDPSVAGTGIHTITYQVSDTNNCVAMDTVQINVLSLPEINAGSDTVICSGDSIQLQATSDFNYSWEPSVLLTDAFISNPIAFPPVSTIFSVTTTDLNECSNTDSILVTVFSAVNTDAGMGDTICAGDTTTLTASGSTDYAWSPADGLNDAAIASPLAFPQTTTMYTVTVNGGSTCPGIDSVLIVVYILPFINAGIDQKICAGDSAQLQASGGSFYLWEPSGSLSNNMVENPVAFPIDTTIYTVTGTDLNGCSNRDSVILTVVALPIIDAGADTSICAGDTLQLSASGGASYIWTPASTLSNDSIAMPFAFPEVHTTYYLTGSDSMGCSNTDSITVFVLSSVLVDAGNDTTICKGDSVTLYASGGGDFSWLPPDGLSNANVANPVAAPLSTTVYTVTVGVGTDCIFSDTIIVLVNELPVVEAGIDSSICPGSSLQLFATGAVNYSWSPVSSLLNPEMANPVATPQNTTVYFVTGTAANGCKNQDSVTISLLPAPVANAGVDSFICMGDSIQLQADGGTSYLWSPSNTLSNPDIADPIAHPIITTAYTVIVNEGGVCSGYDTVMITVRPLPLADAGVDQLVCKDAIAQLNATGGTVYLWSPATGLSSSAISNPTAIVTETVSYTVLVIDQFGCAATDSVQLELIPMLVTTVSADTIICTGTSAQLIAGGGSIFNWTPPETLDNPHVASPVATLEVTTLFTVVISDGICYSDTLQVNVSVSNPFIIAGSDVTLTSGSSFQFNVTASSGNYSWTPSESLSCNNCLNPVATPVTSVSYTVSVTDSSGCSASDDITLHVGCDAETVFIPNAFTPDHNGHNDVLYVRSTGLIDLTYFRVFDRWGKVIFESNDINTGWDGTYKNQLMPPGVYLYTLRATCGNDEVMEKQGNVTLIN